MILLENGYEYPHKNFTVSKVSFGDSAQEKWKKSKAILDKKTRFLFELSKSLLKKNSMLRYAKKNGWKILPF